MLKFVLIFTFRAFASSLNAIELAVLSIWMLEFASKDMCRHYIDMEIWFISVILFSSFMHPYFKTMLSCKWCAIGSCIYSNCAQWYKWKAVQRSFVSRSMHRASEMKKKTLWQIWCEKALSQIILTAIHSNKGNKNGKVCIIRMTVWRMMYGSEHTICVRGRRSPCVCMLYVFLCVRGYDAQKSNTSTMYHTHTLTIP